MSEGIPYLGSKISLISKSEIRYEGILYTIDTNESTVALAKVRSFGTEDRPTDRPVAARDEVYDYIIFRGRDIKDIRVCEPPKPQLTLTGGLPNDPAIVQHSAPTSSVYQSPEYGKHGFGPVGGMPPYYPPGAVGIGQSQPFMGQQASVSGSRSTTPTPVRKSPTIDQGVQVSGVTSTPKDEKKDKKSPPPPTHPLSKQQQQQQQQQQSQNQQHQQRPIPMGPQNKLSNRGRRFNAPNSNDPYDKDPLNSLGWLPTSRRGRGMRGGGGRGGYGKPKDPALDGEFTKPDEPRLKFDNDYDFEQANAEFEEMEKKLIKTKISECETVVPNGDDKKDDSGNETAAGDPEEEQVSYYDRSKSFFDNISCESSERSKGKFQRTDWRQERKLNVETFGVTNSFMRRGGYRGRGYRGRGGYRGGRSRGRGGGGMNMNRGKPFNMNPNRGNMDNRMPNRRPPENWNTTA